MRSDVKTGCPAPDRIPNRTPLMSRPAALRAVIGHGPKGDQLYVATVDAVAVIDNSHELVHTIPVTGHPKHLVANSDGTRVFVTTHEGSVVVINTVDNAIATIRDAPGTVEAVSQDGTCISGLVGIASRVAPEVSGIGALGDQPQAASRTVGRPAPASPSPSRAGYSDSIAATWRCRAIRIDAITDLDRSLVSGLERKWPQDLSREARVFARGGAPSAPIASFVMRLTVAAETVLAQASGPLAPFRRIGGRAVGMSVNGESGLSCEC
jgi:hypothetical protein